MWVDDLCELSAYWPDLADFWPSDDKLVDWYLETNANLVRELTAAPADLECRTFLPAPSPLEMWARRQAHETAVHRFDAEHAEHAGGRFDPAFAADGIDEMLLAFAPRGSTFAIDGPATMVVHATDTDDRWHVTLTPNGITTVAGDGPSDVTLTGKASDLYLTVWNRHDDSTIEVTGNRDLLNTWHQGHRIRWSAGVAGERESASSGQLHHRTSYLDRSDNTTTAAGTTRRHR
ncbi:MAG: maleylpyruvate isomerase family mycothiol-dependent enzyme [Ornithinibacter sp.]